MNGSVADHVVPLSLDGPDTFANCQLLCVDCHAAKTAREAADARAAQSGA
jgi:5-methylcytosine-specific restriction protein A